MDEFNAFVGGVNPGGLRNREEIQLLVCDILKSVSAPMTTEQINLAIQEHGLANYFEVGQAIDDLNKNGVIDIIKTEAGEKLVLNERGEMVLKNLENHLPKTVREKAVTSAVNLLLRERRAKEDVISVETAPGGGYNVTFTLSEKNDVLMRLTLYVADSHQLETVKQNFINDPAKLYSQIYAFLYT
ncbi:MAG: DUF4364 family protein [Clostridiales bacterium]|nr:DUF4364 family protein [Clostridiales bacterium]